MKHARLAAFLLAVCLLISGMAYATERQALESRYDEKEVNAGNPAPEVSDADMEADVAERNAAAAPDTSEPAENVKMTAGDGLYRQAVALKEKGDYEASLRLLKRLVASNPGSVKFEIAYLDVLIDHCKEMKGRGNTAWRLKAAEATPKIKELYYSNAENSDYWVVYAKYSCLIDTRRETHITKALKKAFYYRPNNPEAYIAQADYYMDSSVEYHVEGSQQYGMGQIESSDEPLNRTNLAKKAKTSYESALAGRVSDARKAYILLRLGDLENLVFKNKAAAASYWKKASALAPDAKFSRLAAQRPADGR